MDVAAEGLVLLSLGSLSLAGVFLLGCRLTSHGKWWERVCRVQARVLEDRMCSVEVVLAANKQEQAPLIRHSGTIKSASLMTITCISYQFFLIELFRPFVGIQNMYEAKL